MKALLRTLAIIAAFCLIAQTVRHAYVLWIDPRASVLDKYDKPLKDEIAAAASLDELLGRYEPLRKERERAGGKSGAAAYASHDDGAANPSKSERELHEAIRSWESRAKEIRALRFYWTAGLLLAVFGIGAFKRGARWAGATLLIVGFSEFVYWTSPVFMGSATREFDRLLVNKLAFSIASLAVLAATISLLAIFEEKSE